MCGLCLSRPLSLSTSTPPLSLSRFVDALSHAFCFPLSPLPPCLVPLVHVGLFFAIYVMLVLTLVAQELLRAEMAGQGLGEGPLK